MIRKIVLLVEDNEDNRIIYSVFLSHAGYVVLEAADGDTAIQLVKDHRPDLVLLDISIPKQDGWTVANWIKSNEETSTIPVVALTAHAYDTDRAHAALVGFDDFLAKPVEPREVFNCVQRYIGAPAEALGGP